MIPTEGFIDKWGPLIVLAFAMYNILPALVKEIMGVITQASVSRSVVAKAPYDLAQTVLSLSEGRDRANDLIAIELIGLRAAIASIHDDVRIVMSILKGESK